MGGGCCFAAAPEAPPPPPFPEIVFQTWKSRCLPPHFRAWRASWRRHHPRHRHILWTDEQNRRFVRTHYPHMLDTYDSYEVNIERVDAVRFMFLHKHGGIYADLDFEALRPLDPLLEEHAGFDVVLGRMGDDEGFKDSIPNALMISKPGADFWLYVLEQMQARAAVPERPEYHTGPVLLKHCVDTYTGPSRIAVLPAPLLYPINWAQIGEHEELRKVVIAMQQAPPHEEARRLFPSSYAVTYWTHSWE